jgi:YggT family protein
MMIVSFETKCQRFLRLAGSKRLRPLRYWSAQPIYTRSADNDASQENTMGPVEWLFDTVLGLYLVVIIVGAVMSWLVAFDIINLRNRFVSTIYEVCDRLTTPALAPIRKVVPNLGGVDLSPVVLIIAIQFLQRFAVPLIPF